MQRIVFHNKTNGGSWPAAGKEEILTKQEAIDILTVCNLSEAGEGNEELCEALDMAIVALKEQG